MNPDLEFFLESAFDDIQPSVPGVGRVVVEPDYDTNPMQEDKSKLTEDLEQFLRSQSIDQSAVASPAGQSATVPPGTLAKYIRSVTLHADPVEGAWIEVAPPGNWI